MGGYRPGVWLFGRISDGADLNMITSLFDRIRRSPNLLFYGGVFFVFLVTGIWGGQSIGSSDLFNSSSIVLEAYPAEYSAPTELPATQQMAYPAVGLPAPTEYPITVQRNLLVVSVDHLSIAQPQLESIWLVMYFPGKLDLTFLPLYPDPGEKPAAQSSPLAASFSLDKAGNPSRAFLRQLEDQVWWNNFLVIDQTATRALIDLVSGQPSDDLKENGAQAMAEPPSSWQDASTTIAGQTEMLSQLCEQPQVTAPSSVVVAATLEKLESNLATDLDLMTILDEWQTKSSPALPFHCDFPLSTSSVP